MDVSTFVKGANRRTLAKLAAKPNPAAAQGPSGWAKRQLEKFGWREGKGLGKHEDGEKTCVRADKMEEREGLGFEEVRKKEEASEPVYDIGFFANAYGARTRIKIGGNAEDEAERGLEKKYGGNISRYVRSVRGPATGKTRVRGYARKVDAC